MKIKLGKVGHPNFMPAFSRLCEVPGMLVPQMLSLARSMALVHAEAARYRDVKEKLLLEAGAKREGNMVVLDRTLPSFPKFVEQEKALNDQELELPLSGKIQLPASGPLTAADVLVLEDFIET